MNFYKRHIGDYLKDTAHLSLLEHGVYTRLLDVYYTRESGIPDDQAARLIGARGKDECAALKIVLGEFFKMVDGMWMQDRCEREIELANVQAEANRNNGKKGGRPKAKPNPPPNPNETHEKPNGLSMGSVSESEKNLSHKPLAISHKPEEEQAVAEPQQPPEEPPAPPALEIVPNSRGAAISILMRRNGIEGCNAANPIVDEWSKDPRVTDDLLLTAATMAKARDVLRPGPAYLAPIVKELLNPKPAKPKQDDWHRSDAGIKRKASELGIAARAGWSYDQLKVAVWDEIKRRERQGAVA